MTNEKKATKIVEKYEIKYNNTRDLLWTDLEDVAMEMAEWKDEQIQQIIDYATLNFIATLKHCKLFSEESILKCAEDFQNDLINKLNEK